MLFSTYNCVLASVYNYLEGVHKLTPSLEAICFEPSLFALHSVEGIAAIAHPLHIAERYMARIGADIAFPAFDDIDEALAYADEHLALRGGLSFSINLRYDVLEPLSFDNDLWHFHWMVASPRTRTGPDLVRSIVPEPIRGTGDYLMFDQYENEYYRMDEVQLRHAIDTSFNYREDGRFKPFMEIHLPDPTRTKALMEADTDMRGRLAAAVERYPLALNQDVWNACLKELDRYAMEKPDQGAIYRYMNFAQIMIRCREVVWQYLDREGLGDFEPLQQWRNGWTQYRSVLGITLSRRTADEFRRLVDNYEGMIELEHYALAAIVEELSRTNSAIVQGGGTT
ncbi:hypothetical protein DFQ01_103453 [Paenibacillus cellulosilyticus]|uniref:Butirosin biosynthesis protein H-like n=1 Tax=Paenibacillus cellulosilyticus TaxID=375489 RepID=A0A2V2Z1Q6_9BACL|nr:hypothetical protein [Paenibacillus cellulosilyticus]PWW06549.1 hypothetical protein DFQ01_103453 [Paenibacillus cellulosilyticus]QKS46115.1 hypothetical protein HUB94_18005 [Paenibacillus cellulosilyticus]